MREPRDIFFLRIAKKFATRGTCARRQVGAVAVNRNGHVLATGYNGVPSKFEHCRDGVPCDGAKALPGTDLDRCLAVHAEINMLSQCHNVWAIDTVFLTTSPCFECTKALISSNTRRLIFLEEYPHPQARVIWLRAGRLWVLSDPLPDQDDEDGA